MQKTLLGYAHPSITYIFYKRVNSNGFMRFPKLLNSNFILNLKYGF
ncbi:MAG: hypothetical protein U5L45_03035 [Saprospiraceae bacterium]|nr:hypothetical protein [Saprospiraceae bacterium]